MSDDLDNVRLVVRWIAAMKLSDLPFLQDELYRRGIQMEMRFVGGHIDEDDIPSIAEDGT